MFHVIMYAGSALIGVTTQVVGYGWITKDMSFNPMGAFINLLAVLAWVGLCHIIFNR